MQMIYANAIAFLDEAKPLPDRHEKVVTDWTELEFVSVGLEGGTWRSQLAAFSKNRKRFLCLNDDGPDEGFEGVAAIQRRFLENLFPKPSSFEKPDTSSMRGRIRNLSKKIEDLLRRRH
jgi:hypothetical protein